MEENIDARFFVITFHCSRHQGGRSCAGARGPPPKSLDSNENFKPEHTLFCRELRFVAIYALFFGDLWAKKGLFG